MKILKQSTQVDVLIGPLVDDTDFKTVKESVAYNAAGIDVDVIKGVTKADVTLANAAGDGYWRHISNGYYGVTLSTTDTGTLGRLRLTFEATGVLPAWEDFVVVPANVYDSLVAGSDKLYTDAVEISSSRMAADNVEANIGNLNASIAGLNNLSAAQVNAEVDTALADYDPPTKAELDSGLAGLNNLSAAEVNAQAAAALTAYDPPTKAELDAGLAALNDPTPAAIADAVWDEARTGHVTVGTFGYYLDAAISSVSNAAGTGSGKCTVEVSEGGAGVPNAQVWVTTDSAGTVLVASGTTNDAGKVPLMLNAGSLYYLSAQCPAGYNDIHCKPFVAVAD